MDSVAEPSNDENPSSEDAGGAGFSQEDIDALVNSGAAEAPGDDPPDASAAQPVAGVTDAADGPVDQGSIDALFGAGDAEEAPGDDATGDQVDQASIAALFGGGDAAADSPASAPDADPPPINQADIDALMHSAADGGGEAPAEPDARLDALGRPFDEAAAMQAAIDEEEAASKSAPPAPDPAPAVPFVPALAPPGSAPVQLPELVGSAALSESAKRVSMLNDVALNVRLQLGQTTMLVEDVLALGEGSVVELDKLAGDPVDVLVNNRLIARGEVLVLNDSFCVRISEVLTNDPHRITE